MKVTALTRREWEPEKEKIWVDTLEYLEIPDFPKLSESSELTISILWKMKFPLLKDHLEVSKETDIFRKIFLRSCSYFSCLLDP